MATGNVTFNGVSVKEFNDLQNQHNQLVKDLFNGEVTTQLCTDEGIPICTNNNEPILAVRKIDTIKVKE